MPPRHHVLIQGRKLACFLKCQRTSLPLLPRSLIYSAPESQLDSQDMTPDKDQTKCTVTKGTGTRLFPQRATYTRTYISMQKWRNITNKPWRFIMTHEFNYRRWQQDGPPSLQQRTEILHTCVHCKFMSLDVKPQRQLRMWLLQIQDTLQAGITDHWELLSRELVLNQRKPENRKFILCPDLLFVIVFDRSKGLSKMDQWSRDPNHFLASAIGIQNSLPAKPKMEPKNRFSNLTVILLV